MFDINNIPQIRTTEQLRSVMELIGGKPVTDTNLAWFVCCQNAETLSDLNLRELAELFRDGIVAITTLEQVQDHIDAYFDGEFDGEFDEESNRYLIAGVARQYNKHELSDQLLAIK